MKKKKEQTIVLLLALLVEVGIILLFIFKGRIEALERYDWKHLAIAAAGLFFIYIMYVELRIKRAGQTLVEEKVKTHTLVESLPQGVVVLDPEHRIITANATAAKHLGLDPLDAMGKEFPALFPGDVAARLREGTAGKLQAGKLRLTVAPLRGEAGRLVVVEEPEKTATVPPPTGATAMIPDLWNSLADLAGDLDKMDPSVRQKFASALVRARKAAQAPVEMPKPKKEKTDVADLAREALERSVPVARAKGIRTEIATRGDVSANADRELLRRAIDEVVFNACSYTKDGQVKIAVEGTSREVAVVCTDSGIGIPDGEFARVFDPGFVGENQLPETKGGRGLGLSIARKIVEAHGGSILVESRVGQGTRITLNIPRS